MTTTTTHEDDVTPIVEGTASEPRGVRDHHTDGEASGRAMRVQVTEEAATGPALTITYAAAPSTRPLPTQTASSTAELDVRRGSCKLRMPRVALYPRSHTTIWHNKSQLTGLDDDGLLARVATGEEDNNLALLDEALLG